MEFEFDLEKSESNRKKHGIDFDAAQEAFRDPDALEVGGAPRGELRRIWIGRAAGKLWSAIFTRRGSKIRIISVRRARNNERNLYEG